MLLDELGPAADDLALLLPELRSGTSGGASGDADETRFRLFDGVRALLVRAATTHPAVIVLDDLHWADAPSLQLLAFLTRQLRSAPVLVVGTYRDVEVAASDMVGPTLHDLARSSVSVTLTGLDPDEVAGLITTLAGSRPDDALAVSIHRRTGGNPFFVREVTRLMAAGGVAAGAIPEGVREVVERRLARLPQPCAEMLGVAAVVGQGVSLDVLASATATSVTDLLDLLDEAVRARVLAAPASPLGPYRFAHDLFRETLYDGMASSARVATHGRVARALEERGGDVYAAEVARHWMLALPAGEPAKAVSWSARAAEEAMGQLAFDDAAGHYERALQASEHDSAATKTGRLALQLGLAEALTKAGEGDRARAVLAAVVGAARASGANEELAAAALGIDKLGTRSGISDPHGEALLQEALAGLPEEDPRPRSLVLGALARHRYHTRMEQGAAGDARSLAEEAVEEARRSGDPAVLAAALLALHDAYWVPGEPATRLGVTREMEAAAEAAGDADLLMQATLLRYTALLELGSADAPAQFERFASAARACRHRRASYYLLTRQVMVATMRGAGDEARRLLEESLALGEEIGEPDVRRVHCVQHVALAGIGGHHVWTPNLLDDADLAAFRIGAATRRALELLQLGDVAAARTVLAPYAERPVDELPKDYSWLFAVATFTDGFRRAGFDDAARRAAEVLTRYRGTCIVTAAAVCFDGAVDHFLGRHAAAIGDHDGAVAAFESAIALHERVGASAWAELSRSELATLRAQDTPAGVFRPDGGVWTLTFDDITIHLRDAKGLRDLAVLLASPGVDVHVAELLGSTDRGGADAVLDDAARDAYRRRLSELEADVTEAEAAHDGERAARAKAERDVLVDELSAALGIGGRARTLGDPTERARKAVSARIRDAMGRIADQHTALGEHLQASIATGAFCSYRPRHPVAWEL